MDEFFCLFFFIVSRGCDNWDTHTHGAKDRHTHTNRTFTTVTIDNCERWRGSCISPFSFALQFKWYFTTSRRVLWSDLHGEAIAYPHSILSMTPVSFSDVLYSYSSSCPFNLPHVRVRDGEKVKWKWVTQLTFTMKVNTLHWKGEFFKVCVWEREREGERSKVKRVYYSWESFTRLSIELTKVQTIHLLRSSVSLHLSLSLSVNCLCLRKRGRERKREEEEIWAHSGAEFK